jgi:WXG100 family type VII secretion target
MADISVGYDEVERSATGIRRCTDDIQKTVQDLQGEISRLTTEGFNTQVASKKFQDAYDEWLNGIGQARQGLEGMARHLDSVKREYESWDQQAGGSILR